MKKRLHKFRKTKNVIDFAEVDRITATIAARESGIYKVLERAGKGKFRGYITLTPMWKDSNRKELIFFLIAAKPDIYNSGFFSLKDLKLWVEEKGPIMDME